MDGGKHTNRQTLARAGRLMKLSWDERRRDGVGWCGVWGDGWVGWVETRSCQILLLLHLQSPIHRTTSQPHRPKGLQPPLLHPCLAPTSPLHHHNATSYFSHTIGRRLVLFCLIFLFKFHDSLSILHSIASSSGQLRL